LQINKLITWIILYSKLIYSYEALAESNHDLRVNAEAARMAQMQIEKKCEVAKKFLELEIGTYKKDCEKNSDCTAAYIFADSRAEPAIINKRVKLEKNPQLLLLQENVRKDCGPLWQNRPACSPAPANPVCHKNICTDKNSIPIPPPPPLKLDAAFFQKPFSFGTISRSCAPHDGPAFAIRISPKKFPCGTNQIENDPDIRLQLWDNEFVKNPQPGASTSIGFASICLGKSCEMLESFSFQVLEFSTGKRMKAKVTGKTHKGFSLPEQEFEITWCESQAMMCG
jgi:hypothetical protein